MAKSVSPKPIYRYPGKETLTKFLQGNSKLFNLSELERMCKFAPGTLRHISAGTRTMDDNQYKIVRACIYPKLCELILLLQFTNEPFQDV